MSRFRCVQCHKSSGFCYCDQIKTCHNQWAVWIFQHPNETKHAIGTAKIAHLSLQNSELMIAKSVKECEGLVEKLQHQKPLLVFPSEKSESLESLVDTNQIDANTPLLFLDATWRKAKRMVYESPELQDLRHVHLVSHELPRYKIRKAPQLKNTRAEIENEKSDRKEMQPLSTLEAIVLALSALEKNLEPYQSMLDVMDSMIQKQIDKMGRETFDKNYS